MEAPIVWRRDVERAHARQPGRRPLTPQFSTQQIGNALDWGGVCVDQASFTTFAAPVSRLDQLAGGGMYNELVADAVVLNPGAVILPMAIFK